MIYYTESEGSEMRSALEAMILHWPEVTMRRMFGCPAYLADGKLFVFLVSDGVVIAQIRKHDREALAEVFETEPFKAGEREIPRWVKVTVEDTDRLKRLLGLIRKSYETALHN